MTKRICKEESEYCKLNLQRSILLLILFLVSILNNNINVDLQINQFLKSQLIIEIGNKYLQETSLSSLNLLVLRTEIELPRRQRPNSWDATWLIGWQNQIQQLMILNAWFKQACTDWSHMIAYVDFIRFSIVSAGTGIKRRDIKLLKQLVWERSYCRSRRLEMILTAFCFVVNPRR